MGRTKKSKKLKPDTVVKSYWRNNEQFADFFNAVLFEGKSIIKPEELEDVDTEDSSVQEHREYVESIQASRDNIKIRKRAAEHGVELVMLGIEGQEHIHYAMPMRVMGYDYGVYKKQYDSNAEKYRKADGLDAHEFLSRMKKTDKLTPVITVVIYYGEKAWDGATTLHGMLNISQEAAKYVNDYRMLLVEARKNNLILHNVNNVDLFNLLEIILDRSISKDEALEKAIQYSEEHKTDRTVIMTMAGAANSKIDLGVYEKGEGQMCTLFEEIAREGELKGIEKGRAEGRVEGKVEGKAEGMIEIGLEFGLSEKDILERLQNKLNISLQTARNYMKQFRK